MMISVIVPIFNVGKYLRECLDSICKQTYRDLEIILVDDGSQDDSANICDEYANRDSRIRVMHKKINEGLVRARKDGLQAAKGELIGYVDGDDWIEPDMFERLYDVLMTENVDIAMCGHYNDNGNAHHQEFHGINEGRYGTTELVTDVFPDMIVHHGVFEWGIFPSFWDKLFRRECLWDFQMAVDDRLTIGEDAACIYPCLLNANSIYILHECLYHYRQSPYSMVKKLIDSDRLRQNFRILYHSVQDELKKYDRIYDLSEQWRQYVLILMTVRSNFLYEGMEQLDYLFPFPEVSKGSHIILYGMGTYGQTLYKFIEKTKFCTIVACSDRDYRELEKLGFNMIAPDDIGNFNYDYIVVANCFASGRRAIIHELSAKYDAQKIKDIDENLILNENTMRAFCLI